jgi:putative transcriptional regulator
MKTTEFNDLLASVKEAGEIKRGERPASRRFIFSPPDIKHVRRSLNVSQAAFSKMIGVSVNTLQNWEQGRREPEGPARALLTVAARNPQAVLAALNG